MHGLLNFRNVHRFNQMLRLYVLIFYRLFEPFIKFKRPSPDSLESVLNEYGRNTVGASKKGGERDGKLKWQPLQLFTPIKSNVLLGVPLANIFKACMGRGE